MNKNSTHVLAMSTTLLPLSLALAAGEKILVADRDNDVVWMLHDANANGSIEDSEVSLFWSGAAASGTPTPGTWTAMAIRSDGRIGVGDSTQRFVMSMHDFNHDGDAQDAGESWVVATNTTWNSFNTPSGIAFDTRGTMFVNNSGTSAFPADGIFKLTDLNADGDCEDTIAGVPERIEYCIAPPIGPGNTAYVPFEMTYAGGALYHRDSGSGVQGVWKTVDLDLDGDANDPGEFSGFAINGNASGFVFGAGLVIEPDLARERALYTIQVASQVDQLIRVVDVNDDGDAMDAGEITLVYSTAEANYSPTDILCLPDGSVLIGDSTGKKIYRLNDTNSDGLFDASERSTWFDNVALTVSDFRRLVLVPVFCPADLDSGNGAGIPDGGVDINDLLFFLTTFEAGTAAADLDNDGLDPAQPDGGVDINDLLFFLTHFEAGC
jgi:hypothetical protein